MGQVIPLHEVPSLRDKVSEEEWQLRCELAAVYRLVYRFGWDDGIFTHSSVRLPGKDHHFLINPYGHLFNEVCASNLVKIDVDGNVLDDSPYDVIRAGFVIHSAIHMSRADAMCVIHTHTNAGMAVSAQKGGLLPLNQKSMMFYNRVTYHDYEGISNDIDERDRLVADLGNHHSMILRNHGLLSTGRSIAEAFYRHRLLEHSCELQLQAQMAGTELIIPPKEVCEHAASQFEGDGKMQGDSTFQAYMRLLDKEEPDYRH
ncbi:MAG TPA: class II aldolase [Rhodospirillaceae bacterium]|nr:class II aldolase [Rhodospirillaceae bacterium]